MFVNNVSNEIENRHILYTGAGCVFVITDCDLGQSFRDCVYSWFPCIVCHPAYMYVCCITISLTLYASSSKHLYVGLVSVCLPICLPCWSVASNRYLPVPDSCSSQRLTLWFEGWGSAQTCWFCISKFEWIWSESLLLYVNFALYFSICLLWHTAHADCWSLCVWLTGAVLYYYTYKRTALRLSDPRFYQINDWIIAEFEKKL